MENMQIKPKLIFFQFRYDENVPEFLLIHKYEHVKCLSEFFDVTVIDNNCDYQRVCEKYEPDLALFESGLQLATAHRLDIRNTGAFPEIPKLGFLNADAWSDTREGILSDMEHWGIETFFSICTTAAEHTPEIAHHLFVWPNFIDPEIYKDYNESKIVPILITGCQDQQYPWRHKVYKIVSGLYPSLVCPHRGYRSRSEMGQMMYGERYARAINASWFAPTCGTVAKEVVRKHLEIPGCRTCLLTEESVALKAAGFVDMKNCVFVDEHNVTDKLAYLFQHKDELGEIIDAGFRLVHSHHTTKQRNQIFQWFKLYKNLKINQKIVQMNPFGPLEVVEKSLRIENSHIYCNGVHLALFRQADKLLWAGQYEEAEHLYYKCSNFMGNMMAEPRVRIALCNLYKGNPRKALSWIAVPLQRTLAEYKAIDPDPVEWACFIICLVCIGKLKAAVKRASQFPWLRHPELDRTRVVINILRNNDKIMPLPDGNGPKARYSIHQLPNRSFDEWIYQLCVMLKACGKYNVAQTLTNSFCKKCLSVQQKTGSSGVNIEGLVNQIPEIHKTRFNRSPLVFGMKVTLCRFNNPLLYAKVGLKLKKVILNFFHRLEVRWKLHLPYYFSEMKNDDYFVAIQRLARDENIRNALVVGAYVGGGSTEAFLAGAQENEKMASVFCLSGSRRRFVRLKKSFANFPFVKWYRLQSFFSENPPEEPEKTVKNIKEENQITYFDAVLIDGSRVIDQNSLSEEIEKEIHEAKVVILEDINAQYNYLNNDEMLKDPNYILVDHDPELRNGYAIFKKINLQMLEGDSSSIKTDILQDDEALLCRRMRLGLICGARIG
jgi:hypothetical protein